MKEETSETDVKDGIVRAYDLAYLSIELKHGQQRAVYLADVWFTNS